MFRPAEDDSLIDSLSELGLTVYEAKAYVALLKKHPAKAHDVSKGSGVPAARVYEVMKRLVDKGLAVPMGSEPVRYEPLPAKEFIRLHKARFKHLLDKVGDRLESLSQRPGAEVLWHIYGYENLLEKVREIIAMAAGELLISLWTPQIEDLYGDLTAARARGITVVIMQMGEDPSRCPQWPVGQVYRHLMVPTVYERHGSELLLSVDGSYGLMMNQAGGGGWEGFWTSNPAIVRVITNYVRHDIYLAKIIDRLPELIRSIYGKDLELLLNVQEDKAILPGAGGPERREKGQAKGESTLDWRW